MEYYLLFALTTALCILFTNMNIIRKYKISAGFIFYAMTFLISFVLAPIYFIIYMFFSDNYKENILEALQRGSKNNS